MGTAQMTNSRKKTGYGKKIRLGSWAISPKSLSTGAAVNFGAEIPAKFTHRFPGRGRIIKVTAELKRRFPRRRMNSCVPHHQGEELFFSRRIRADHTTTSPLRRLRATSSR
jgi:hypothetical protein